MSELGSTSPTMDSAYWNQYRATLDAQTDAESDES